MSITAVSLAAGAYPGQRSDSDRDISSKNVGLVAITSVSLATIIGGAVSHVGAAPMSRLISFPIVFAVTAASALAGFGIMRNTLKEEGGSFVKTMLLASLLAGIFAIGGAQLCRNPHFVEMVEADYVNGFIPFVIPGFGATIGFGVGRLLDN